MNTKSLQNITRNPLPGIANVEELELENGQRALAPTAEWTDSIADSPQGGVIAAFYMFMGVIGMPPAIILSIAAVRFADTDRKIDFEQWVNTRSGWSAEDRKGALMVVKTVDERAAQREGMQLSQSKKDPADDYNLN